MQALWQQYDADIPATVVEDVLLTRYAFTPQQLREIMHSSYNPQTETYYYPGGRGGGQVEGVVTYIQQDGPRVALDYLLFFGNTEEPGGYTTCGGVLVLQQQGEGESLLYYGVITNGSQPPDDQSDIALQQQG